MPEDSRVLFDFGLGIQYAWLPGLLIDAWAVHDGDVPSVPEPTSTALMLAGLLAAALEARRRFK